MTIFLKLFPKLEEEGTLPTSFYKVSITQIPKTLGEWYRPISFIKIVAKNSQQNASKLKSAAY